MIKLSVEEKAELFDRLLMARYEQLIYIDLATAEAETLYVAHSVWDGSRGTRYPYDEMMSRYIMDRSVGADTEATLEKLRLEEVRNAVGRRGFHSVGVTVRDPGKTIAVKRMIFIPCGESALILMLENLTNLFEEVTTQRSEIAEALDDASGQISDRTEFLKLLSRNIRAPLYSIMGLTRIELERPSDQSAFDSYLRKVSMSGTYMKESIDDVLELRRIARREIELHEEPVRFADLFSHINDAMQLAVYDKGLSLALNADGVISLVVMADPHALTQIIIKLLRSAVAYTVKGGRISLDVREMFRSDDQTTLEISVTSRGLVMDQERMYTLFRPYDYLTERIDSEIGTLDMDLIILKRYLNAMKAETLVAESDEQTGTRLSVMLTLPVAGERAGRREAKRPELAGRRVLIVDDNEINLEIGQKILTDLGAEVVTATNGKEAVDTFRAEEGRFDLILMDVLMPEMDGLDATREIRGMEDIEGASEIPIIAMTANAFRNNFEESMHAGMNAHLVKPIDTDRLYRAINEALTGE